MNFDIKDVKSWANRHDVKVGDVGYFADSILVLDNRISMDCRGIIKDIRDRQACCFAIKNDNDFCFFLPLSAVKEDKPKEKKYRPFKTIDEINDLFDNAHNSLIGMILHLRSKQDHSYKRTVLVTTVDRIGEEIKKINKCSMEYLFNSFEVYVHVKGGWLPFGVEVEDE